MHEGSTHETPAGIHGRRQASDGVYLSTPLLLIGATAFTWALQHKLGSVGIGAFLSVCALAVAGIHLQKTVATRAKWQESSFALSTATCASWRAPEPASKDTTLAALLRARVEHGVFPAEARGQLRLASRSH